MPERQPAGLQPDTLLFDKYRLEKFLSQGAFAKVYLGNHLS
jgi:hypothetical protein